MNLYTQYLNGAKVVVSAGPDCPFTADSAWPVLYSPRTKFDPSPWVAYGTDFRYNGKEVHVTRTEETR